LTAHTGNARKEILMSDNTETRRRTDGPRFKTARNALLWVGLIALALFPFPWWW
jgi:hypothetical protein